MSKTKAEETKVGEQKMEENKVEENKVEENKVEENKVKETARATKKDTNSILHMQLKYITGVDIPEEYNLSVATIEETEEYNKKSSQEKLLHFLTRGEVFWLKNIKITVPFDILMWAKMLEMQFTPKVDSSEKFKAPGFDYLILNQAMSKSKGLTEDGKKGTEGQLQVDGVAYDNITGVLCYQANSRSWMKAYNDTSDGPAVICSSPDGIKAFNGTFCEKCPESTFGSGRCKKSLNLYFYIPELDKIAVFYGKSANFTAANAIFTACNKSTFLWNKFVELGSEEKKFDKNTAFVLTGKLTENPDFTTQIKSQISSFIVKTLRDNKRENSIEPTESQNIKNVNSTNIPEEDIITDAPDVNNDTSFDI
jgi:hypothetical protein